MWPTVGRCHLPFDVEGKVAKNKSAVVDRTFRLNFGFYVGFRDNNTDFGTKNVNLSAIQAVSLVEIKRELSL